MASLSKGGYKPKALLVAIAKTTYYFYEANSFKEYFPSRSTAENLKANSLSFKVPTYAVYYSMGKRP